MRCDTQIHNLRPLREKISEGLDQSYLLRAAPLYGAKRPVAPAEKNCGDTKKGEKKEKKKKKN